MKYDVLKKQNNSDMCFVCGMSNSASMKARFYECLKDTDHGEKILLTVIEPKDIHQSYPNRMHGGLISALLDESIGRAVQIDYPDLWAVTIDLNVKFRKPVPLDQTIYVESKITNLTARAYEGEGKIFLRDGTVCATATAKYLIVPFKQAVGDAVFDHTKWFLVKEDLPKTFIF